MAVVTCKRIAAGRSGNADDKFNREYKVVYQVIVNSAHDGPAVVGTATGLPARFDSYAVGNDVDLQALCTHLDVTQNGNEWKDWRVTATFRTNVSDDQNQSNPLNRPVEKWVEASDWQKPNFKNTAGDAIKNSAGQVYPGLTKDDIRETFMFERNEATVDYAKIRSYQNTVNTSTWNGCAARTCKMRITVGRRQIENGVAFYTVTYSVQYRPETWDLVLVDRGTLIKANDGTDAWEVPRDEFEHDLGEVNLDGAGNRLDPSDDPEFLPAEEIYTKTNFNSLGLV